MDFLAIDVETANADYASICQIGIAGFESGKFCYRFENLINPQNRFDPFNVSIHGIDEEAVRLSPAWNDLFPTLEPLLRNRILVSHSPFDRVALQRAEAKYSLDPLACNWLDSAKVARRVWKQFAYRGYGLSNLANHIGWEYRAHDALEDARCAGEILLRAMGESGYGISEWLVRSKLPISTACRSPCNENINQNGPLFGEVVVFTGTGDLVRSEASLRANHLGCEVADRVTRKTTMLVVGRQRAEALNGFEKSSKHRAAEQRILAGSKLRILTTEDFNVFLRIAGE